MTTSFNPEPEVVAYDLNNRGEATATRRAENMVYFLREGLEWRERSGFNKFKVVNNKLLGVVRGLFRQVCARDGDVICQRSD